MILALICRFLLINVFLVTSDEGYDIQRSPGKKTVSIMGERGQCMVLVFNDGYLHQCFDRTQVSRFDLKSIRNQALLLLYEGSTGQIHDMSKIPVGYDDSRTVNTTSTTTVSESGDVTTAKDSTKPTTYFELLWPKVGEVVSTANIDFRFDWTLSDVQDTETAALCVALNKTKIITTPRTNKDNTNSPEIQQDEVTMIVRCSDNIRSSDLGNVLTIAMTEGGRYLSRFYLFRTPINDTLFLINATGVINGTNAVLTPHRPMTQKTRESTFLDLLLYRPQVAPSPSFSMILSVMLPKTTETTSDIQQDTKRDTSPHTTTDNTASEPGLHNSDNFSKHRYWSHKITVLRTLDHSYAHNNPASASANDFASGEGTSGVDASPSDTTTESAADSTNINDIMHAVVISVFSLRRYLEAEVMLKSLFMHRITKHPLVLHMIVDPAGKQHFTKVFSHPAIQKRAHSLAVIFHDFDVVCGDPLIPFLEHDLDGMKQSFHHSGKAGYCRLFIAPYFHRLRQDYEDQTKRTIHHATIPASSSSSLDNRRICSSDIGSKDHNSSGGGNSDGNCHDHPLWPFSYVTTKTLLLPRAVMAIETDQLILSNIFDLWRHFEGFQGDEVVAAAENYQPWMDSRPMANAPAGTSDNTDTNDNSDTVVSTDSVAGNTTTTKSMDAINFPSNDGTYHGYGIIGGIMLLHVDRMRSLDWHHRSLVPLVRQYQKHHSDASPSSDNNNTNDKNYDNNHNHDTATNNDATTDTNPGTGVWQAQMNDQDIFNAALALAPQYFHILPCAWNVQFHARLNTIIHCAHRIFENSQYLQHNTPNDDNNNNHTTPSNLDLTNLNIALDAISIFASSTVTKFKQEMLHRWSLTDANIPLNCPEAQKQRIFVCENRPKVLHYQARSYQVGSVLTYFEGFWGTYSTLPWDLVFDS